MKKKLLVLTLSFGLLAFGATSAFADNEDVRDAFYGHGHGYYQSDLSVEEIHALKIERIDQLLKDGKITASEAENYKNIIAERQVTCDGLASNRDNNERLGIGFGEGLRDGSGQRMHGGHHGGYRNR